MEILSVRSIRQLLIAVAAVLALGLVVRAYEPAQSGAFIWDDHVLAEADAAFRHVPLTSLVTHGFWPDEAVGDARAPYYRPLVLVSLRFDAALGGTPVEYHFTNLFLHLVACCLLAVTARRLGARSGGAVIAALAWGLAPRLTESVAWISGRGDVLATALGLAALVLSPDVGADPSAGDHRSPVAVGARAIGAGLCIFGALLSKEVAIAFAGALAIAAIAARRNRRALVRATATVALPLAAWLTLRTVAVAGAKRPEQTLGAAGRAGTALEAVARYAEMMLDFARPRTSIGLLGELDGTRAALGSVLVVAGVLLALRYGRRLSANGLVAVAVGLGGLAPVLHIVPLALAGSVAADRLLYVPLVGAALSFAVAASSLASRGRLVAALATLSFIAVSFGATRARALDYTDEARFWVVAAEHAHPRNVVARNALALVAHRAGEIDLSCRLRQRSADALAGTPFAWLATHKRTLESLVNCLARSGRYDDAVRLAEDLSRRYPTSGRVQMELGFARLHVRDFDGAASAFGRARELDPHLTKVVAPVLEKMSTMRAEWAELEKRSAPERSVWARHLASIGRAKEADAAFLAIALDASESSSERQRAIAYLVLDGSIASAERVIDDATPPVRRRALLEDLRARQRARARLEAVRDRVEALAR